MSFDLECVDGKGVVVARYHFGKLSLKKTGRLEIVDSRAQDGAAFEEMMVTGLAFAFYVQTVYGAVHCESGHILRAKPGEVYSYNDMFQTFLHSRSAWLACWRLRDVSGLWTWNHVDRMSYPSTASSAFSLFFSGFCIQNRPIPATHRLCRELCFCVPRRVAL